MDDGDGETCHCMKIICICQAQPLKELVTPFFAALRIKTFKIINIYLKGTFSRKGNLRDYVNRYPTLRCVVSVLLRHGDCIQHVQ